jgi:nicotinate phosphoribosyltransferase
MATLPDRKRLVRAVASDGTFIQDIVALAAEEVRPGDTVYDPVNPLQHVALPANARLEELRSVVMANGKKVSDCSPLLDAMADRCAGELSRLPQGCLRFVNHNGSSLLCCLPLFLLSVGASRVGI